MRRQELEQTARKLIAEGKGILAADETVSTITKRFATLKIESTEDSRRAYREMFFTTPDVSAFISGVILQDETIRQKNDAGISLTEVLSKQGILPGIKVDTGAKVLAGSPEEKMTEGLDGLRDRLKEYAAMGARFAKWRAVIHITDALPSPMCVNVNAHALARYAALCQEQDIVPIVEPEVLMEGSHSIERCEEVTSSILHAVFQALFEQCVGLEGMLPDIEPEGDVNRAIARRIGLGEIILNVELTPFAGIALLEQLGKAADILDVIADDAPADEVGARGERVLAAPAARARLLAEAWKGLDPHRTQLGAHQGLVLDVGDNILEDVAEAVAGLPERGKFLRIEVG